MSDIINMERIRREKQDDEALFEGLTWLVKWELMISSAAHSNDIKLAMGYPAAKTDVEAIRNWIDDNMAQLYSKPYMEAASIIITQLTAKITAFYGHRRWQRPEEYER